jgi:hypothetical protein
VIRNNRIIGDQTGLVEVVDFDPELQKKQIKKTDGTWKIIKGELKKGSK